MIFARSSGLWACGFAFNRIALMLHYALVKRWTSAIRCSKDSASKARNIRVSGHFWHHGENWLKRLWEAAVLPLNYARGGTLISRDRAIRQAPWRSRPAGLNRTASFKVRSLFTVL